jgi:ATP-binding cassette subfamily C protein
MSKGIRHWIFIITALKLLVLVGTASFARTVSGFLGNITDPQMTTAGFSQAVLSALLAALVILLGEVLIGEAEYRCTARVRLLLREKIFAKMLLLDVGSIEKIGTTAAVASAVDGIEQMQTYYCHYLPGLIYCMTAPIYLFFQLKSASMPVAVFLLIVTLLLFPANNIFRQVIQNLKNNYWVSFSDLTGHYLESLQSLTTLKLFNQDERRTRTLKAKADDFNQKIMAVMQVNFAAFLFSDSIIYISVFVAVVIVANQLL